MSDPMRRHRHDTPEWADAVIARWQRRRDLPRRQLAAAWSDLLEELFGPAARWLSRMLER